MDLQAPASNVSKFTSQKYIHSSSSTHEAFWAAEKGIVLTHCGTLLPDLAGGSLAFAQRLCEPRATTQNPVLSPEAGHEMPCSAQQPAQRLLDAVCWRGRLGWLLTGCLAALRASAQLPRWCLLPVQRNPHQLPGRLRRASEANPFNKQVICTFFCYYSRTNCKSPRSVSLGVTHNVS